MINGKLFFLDMILLPRNVYEISKCKQLIYKDLSIYSNRIITYIYSSNIHYGDD